MRKRSKAFMCLMSRLKAGLKKREIKLEWKDDKKFEAADKKLRRRLPKLFGKEGT